jgi:hypothetical protein
MRCARISKPASSAALQGFNRLDVPFRAALQVEQADVRGIPEASRLLSSETQSAERWQRLARAAGANIAEHGVRPLPLSVTKPRSAAGTAFQNANDAYSVVMQAHRTHDVTNASNLADIIDVLLVLTLAITALLVATASRRQEKRRTDALLAAEVDRAARERRYADARRHFSQVLLASDTEAEASTLISDDRVPGAGILGVRAAVQQQRRPSRGSRRRTRSIGHGRGFGSRHAPFVPRDPPRPRLQR